MAELKKCPFCNGKAELTTGSVFMWEHAVVCTKCGIRTKSVGGITPSMARERAIESWNQRAYEWRKE